MADVMSPEKRSALMSRIRGRDTGIELLVFAAMRRAGVRFKRHAPVIRGCVPDAVLPSARVAVFIDGDFWHGWRFPRWRHKLTPFWRAKIEQNRLRDRRKFRRLRARGWTVIRVWEHEIERDLAAVVHRIRETAAGAVSR